MNDDTLESGTHENQDWRIRRVPDGDVENPRDMDNQWILVMNHRRRTLGDKQLSGSAFAEFKDEEGLNAANTIEVPVYAYEHGGIAFSVAQTGQFTDRFDAGQIGVAYITLAKLKEEYGEDTPENRERALSVLKSELETYEQFINGETYGFVYEVRPADSDEDWTEEDSCFGFYGADPKENGMKDYFPAHVIAQMDAPVPASPAEPARRRRQP